MWVGSDVSVKTGEMITLEQVFYNKNSVSAPTDVEIDTICQVQLPVFSCIIDNSDFSTTAKLVYTLTNIAGQDITLQSSQLIALTFYVSHVSNAEPSARNFGVELKYGTSIIN